MDSVPFKVIGHISQGCDAWESVIWDDAKMLTSTDVSFAAMADPGCKFKDVMEVVNDFFETTTGRKLRRGDFDFVLRALGITLARLDFLGITF